MSLENPTINQFRFEPIDVLKKKYKEILEKILYKQLTLENIETFTEETLSETIALTEKILQEYKNNPNVKPRIFPGSAKSQEDEAYKILDLPDLGEVLQSISEVKQKIDHLKIYINDKIEKVDVVITPPQSGAVMAAGAGKMVFEKKKIFPRLLTLLYILDHDFGIIPAPKHIKKGKVLPGMIRQTPYVRVEIPKLNRVIYICDEAGNVSYVFDTKRIAENNLTLEEIDLENKREKNALIRSHLGIGVRIEQTRNWRSIMSDILRESDPEKWIQMMEKQKITSEFRGQKKWLAFEDFQGEVRELYAASKSEEKRIKEWYDQEQKKHADWPSAPHDVYKNRGWVGLPELFGKFELITKKKGKAPPFLDLKNEVQRIYPHNYSNSKWYSKERKKHSNWPSDPELFYGDEGWNGWPDFLGKKNRFEKKKLTFEEFKNQVRSVYNGESGVEAWYQVERRKYSDWPATPNRTYGGRGWVSYAELVGKGKK